jgi:hypothetical protein
MILTRFTLGSNERKLRFSWITVRGLRASNECSEAGMVSTLLLVGERFLPRMMQCFCPQKKRYSDYPLDFRRVFEVTFHVRFTRACRILRK